jgi:glycosyltransferase involved in cell wall biosynthesis
MQLTDLTLAICLYNAEKYIAETLECVVNQTFLDFHLLIINDCSSDSSVCIVEEFFAQHPRQYELVNFEENRGIAYARHFAERYATTKYIMFVDADDLPYPELIEKLYQKIASDNDLIAVGCYLEYLDNNGKKIGGGIFLGDARKEDFFEKAKKQKLIFMQPTAIYNRESALSVGGYNITGYPDGKPRYQDFCEDLDLWTRMSDLYVEGKYIVVVPEILCKYRKHENALSSNSLGMVLRMKHIKTNLLRRRAGQTDRTFIEFYDSLSDSEMHSLKKDALAADSLRNGVFYLRKGNFLQGIKNIAISIWNRPTYIVEKIRKNSGFCK